MHKMMWIKVKVKLGDMAGDYCWKSKQEMVVWLREVEMKIEEQFYMDFGGKIRRIWGLIRC